MDNVIATKNLTSRNATPNLQLGGCVLLLLCGNNLDFEVVRLENISVVEADLLMILSAY